MNELTHVKYPFMVLIAIYMIINTFEIAEMRHISCLLSLLVSSALPIHSVIFC